MGQTQHPPKAFISYKWEDEAHNEWVKQFATDLRKAGIEAILDRWEVRLGDSFADYMTSRIKGADIFLFIITTKSVAAAEATSGAVKFEVQMATARRTAGENVRLIGIYREGNETPMYLRDHRYADFRDDSKYDESFRELVADLLDEVPIPPVEIGLFKTIIGKDGTEMALIPAGEFQMGDYYKEHTVYLDAFYMDKYPVTNKQYRGFVQATEHREPVGRGYIGSYSSELQDGFRPWSDARFNGDDQPVVCVSWDDAVAYAEWAGKQLPTEAQWEKAARGGLVGMRYPWGNEITEENANYGRKVGKTTPVGSYQPNDYGLYDMAGNVREWCADWYDRDYYSKSPDRNPTGPDTGSSRVLRGGSWSLHAAYLEIWYRVDLDPSYSSFNVGFRCATSRSD